MRYKIVHMLIAVAALATIFVIWQRCSRTTVVLEFESPRLCPTETEKLIGTTADYAATFELHYNERGRLKGTVFGEFGFNKLLTERRLPAISR